MGRSGGGDQAVGIGTGKLLGYLCEEGLGDDVGILLQARVAEGDKSGHRRREKTDLERVVTYKHTTVITVRAAWKHTKTRMVFALSFQISTFSWSNFCARVVYILKMAPEGAPKLVPLEVKWMPMG